MIKGIVNKNEKKNIAEGMKNMFVFSEKDKLQCWWCKNIFEN